MSVKNFQFNKDYDFKHLIWGCKYTKGTTLDVKIINGKECVCDGCAVVFELNSDVAKEYGETEIIIRPW